MPEAKGKCTVRFPGVVGAAKALGVNVRTLQRVLGGEWNSKTLTARYRQLAGLPLSKDQQAALAEYQRRQAMKTPPNVTPDATVFAEYNREALENFQPAVFASHQSLGLATVAVVLRWTVEPVVPYLDIFQELNGQLAAAGAGRFVKEFLCAGRQLDLVDCPREWRGQWADIGATLTGRFVNFPGEIWGVFHLTNLPTGLNLLQASLAPRAPQIFARIYHAQTLNTFREHWPQAGRSVCL